MQHMKPTATLIAHKAKKLGYTVQELKTGSPFKEYYVQSHTKSFLVNGNVFYPNVPRWQHVLMGSKLLSEALLQKKKYNKIRSVLIYAKQTHSKKELTTRATALDTFPVIIKPEEGFQAKGITVAYTKRQLIDAVSEIVAKKQNVLVQELLFKKEYRILVVEGKVMALHSKGYPTIIGDGKKTIAQLLKEQKTTYVNDTVVDYECKKIRKKRTDVLDAGVSIPCHITQKGTFEYYESKKIPKAIKAYVQQLCIDNSIKTAGIDVFIDGTPKKPTDFTIIELNSNPGFRYLQTKYKDKDVIDRITSRIVETYFT